MRGTVAPARNGLPPGSIVSGNSQTPGWGRRHALNLADNSRSSFLCLGPQIATLLMAVALCGRSQAQDVDSRLWSVNPWGSISAVARAGDRLYVGGYFFSVGPATGGGVPVDLATGQPVGPYPKIAGVVNAAISDGHGGWYVGGDFAGAYGQPRRNLAHLLADGRLADWAPDANGVVWSLALVGRTLIVGGDFTVLDGQPRQHVAAFDTRTGRLLSWDPGVDGRVWALCGDRGRVFVGGAFTQVGGQTRHELAAVDLATGACLPWNPDADFPIYSFALRDTVLYAGGLFSRVGDQSRRFVAAISTESGVALPWDARVAWRALWDHDTPRGVTALCLRDTLLYVAGEFDSIGGQPRQGLTAVSATTAGCASWDPQARGWPDGRAYFAALAVSRGAVYVGGVYDSLGGVASRRAYNQFAAAVDAKTGRALEWNPRPDDELSVLCATDREVFVGGVFRSLWDWQSRRFLIALDLRTGELSPWDPAPNDGVRAILVKDSTVYVGGDFTDIGGQPRSRIAALDAATGRARDWNPGANGRVCALAFKGDRLLAGGAFSEMGGLSRAGIADLSLQDGSVAGWGPAPDPGGRSVEIDALAVTDSVVYVGGGFNLIDGQRRVGLAALDVVTGLATPWVCDLYGHAASLALHDSTLFVGGVFPTAAGQPRSSLAAIDTRTGQPTPWVADAAPLDMAYYAHVNALEIVDSTLYVGGAFSAISGTPRSNLAALDLRTGAVRDWDPSPDTEGVVAALAASEGQLYVGGAFIRMGAWPQAGVAAVTMLDSPPAPHPGIGWLAQNAPNPSSESTAIRYSLPTAARVDLDVFDLQGRHVVAVVPGELQSAGLHQVLLSTCDWRPGCYFYRLRAGPATATRKMLVVR